MKILKIDHLGIAVKDLAEAVKSYQALGFAVDATHDVPTEKVRAAFYLMRARGEQPPTENRAVRWVAASDAARLLTHAQSRHVLETALPHLAKL